MKRTKLFKLIALVASLGLASFQVVAEPHDCAAHCAKHTDANAKMCTTHCSSGAAEGHDCAAHCKSLPTGDQDQACAMHCSNIKQ